MKCSLYSFFFLVGYSLWGGGGFRVRVRALNLTVPLGSGRVGSDNLGYGPGSGFSFEAVQTSNQESPRSDIFLKRTTKPLLKQKQRQKHLIWPKEKKNWTVAQWSKVLFSDESKLCISFGNQGPGVWRKRGEAQNPCCLKSSVKFPQSVMIWATMSSAGVGPLYILKSTVNVVIYQEISKHFMLPSADKLYGDADLIFKQDLAPAHTAKGTLHFALHLFAIAKVHYLHTSLAV